jgi:hypothetical protein
MRIGFDGKRAVQNFTGLGNYSRYIVDILCQFYPENEYVLYAPKKRENKRLDKLTKQYQQLQLSYPTTSSSSNRIGVGVPRISFDMIPFIPSS